MPAGNVAHGLVWSHFTGFLQYVLPGKIIVEIDPFIAIKWHCYNQDTKVETQMKNKRREPNWVKRTPTKTGSESKLNNKNSHKNQELCQGDLKAFIHLS